MFKVVVAAEADRFYTRADRPLARKLARCFGQLEQDPRHHNHVKRMRGEFAGLYRFRVDDYRVVYEIDDAARRVLILKIAHRREVYE